MKTLKQYLRALLDAKKLLAYTFLLCFFLWVTMPFLMIALKSIGRNWFGKLWLPPDLTLVARSRSAVGQGSGADYIYTFLRTFYRDETKITGWNNLAFPNVGMPHVLWELQGQQRAVYADEKDPHDPAKTVHVFKGFEQISPGTMSQEEYNLAVADLVAFLKWMSEPNQNDRVRLGVWVLIFLAVFTLIAWRLNAAYWKDVK